MPAPKHSFNLESKTKMGKGQTLSLLFNFRYGFAEMHPLKNEKKYVPMRMSTGFALKADEWDAAKSGPSHKYRLRIPLTKRMNDLVKVSEELLADYMVNNGNSKPHPHILRDMVKRKLGMADELQTRNLMVDVIERILSDNEKIPVNAKGKFGDKQAAKYRTLKAKLEGFAVAKNIAVTVDDFDETRLLEFRSFMNEQNIKKCGKALMLNSISKDNNTLLTVLRKAVNDFGMNCALTVNSGKYRLAETDARRKDVVVDLQSLRRIIETEPIGLKSYENARNFLIICCLTGLRYQSMAKLSGVAIEEVRFIGPDGRSCRFKGFYIEIDKAAKGGIPVEVFIPILQPIQDILDAHGGQFPSFPANKNINPQLKAFARFAQLDKEFTIRESRYDAERATKVQKLYEVLTCHVGRGSFITNLRNLGVPMEFIEPLTHPKKQVGVVNRVYDKTTQKEVAIRLVKLLLTINDPLYRIEESLL
jgi:hypothetical protein